MDLLLFEAIASILTLLAFSWLAGRKHGFRIIAVASVVMWLIFFDGWFAWLWLFLGETSLLSFMCALLKAKPKAFRIGCVLALLGNFAVIGWQMVEIAWKIKALQKEFPFESVAERLSYEAKISPDETGLAENPSASVKENLRTRDSYLDRNMRGFRLRKLHSENAIQFTISEGFGEQRVRPGRGLSRAALVLPPRQPVPLTKSAAAPSFVNPLDGDLANSLKPDSGLLLDHLREQGKFFDRLGYAKDVDHVAGFESHGFDEQLELRSRSSSWSISQLELVSLLRHSTPRAYLSQNLPQMDELKQAPTRTLTEFEHAALVQLRKNEDVVILDGGSEIQMLGSLRASEHCLKCHSVRVGDLLGALSYRLVSQSF